MNKKTYLEFILPKVNDLFEVQQFKFKPSKSAYERKFEYGWIQLSFDYHESYPPLHSVNWGVEVRYNFVEEICNRYNYINPAEVKKTGTILFTIPRLVNYEYPVFNVLNEKELSAVIDDYFLPFLINQLPDLVLQCSNLSYAYNVLISDPVQTYGSIIRSLALAKRMEGMNMELCIAEARDKFVNANSFDVELYDTFFDKFIHELFIKEG
jgi:hypothetical protein